MPIVVSAPGKLILMGEHAAVYGRPALVAAVDRRLVAGFAARRGGGVSLRLPQAGCAEELAWEEVLAYAGEARRRWERSAAAPGEAALPSGRGEGPGHLLKIALGEAALALGEAAPAGVELTVTSEIPAGSGFGSSAAAAVAVVAGYLALRGEALEVGRIGRVALEVERRQHGTPSGVDAATVLHGGMLWARRGEGGALSWEAVEARSPLLAAFRVYDTGRPPDSTGAVVAAVRERWRHDPSGREGILDRIEAASRALRALLERERPDAREAVEPLREAEARLEELGVVPGAVRELVRRVEGEGGAAKVSGAGSARGPAAGSLLVYHPEPERIARWKFLQELPLHRVVLGGPGFRREGA